MTQKHYSLFGMKVTPQRIAVYDALKSLGHASTDVIIKKVQELSPNISSATIYNTLEKFVTEKLISRIPTDGSKIFFDITEPPHIHLVSEDHSRMTDLNDDKLQQVVEDYLTRIPIPGFSMNRVQVVLIGQFE